jgi:serine/threonine protein kinase
MTDEMSRPLLGGRYRVDALLGRGGMSEVHHGHDERLDRPVAIKMLRQPTGAVPVDSPEAEELADAQRRDRARFLREIRTAARLEHPGCPAVYDTGVDEFGDGTSRIWLVMQLLRGSTLQAELDHLDYEHDPPPVAWAAAIGAQIAAVLADVHRVDIVHRDIKPANVMIIDGGLVKVLDFGIAILRGASTLPRLTQVDRTVGTPTYMSPEQHLGRPVTPAADVYSLGCLLYELLTGDPPFIGTTDTPLRAHHLQSCVPSVLAARDDVPPALDDLLRSMLAKRPDDRPTAERVYTALVPLITGPPTGDAARDPTRPFRSPLLAPATRRTETRGGTPLTETEFDAIPSAVHDLIAQDRTSEAVRVLEAALDRTPSGGYFALELRRLLGTALFYDGGYRRSATLLTAVVDDFLARGLPPGHVQVVECAYLAGHAYAELGDVTRALAHLRFFVQHGDPADAEDTEPVLDARFLIAQLLAADDRPDEALAELDAVRPAFLAGYGASSTHVRNLDRQLDRLRPGAPEG